jgi:tryptophan synthase alpha chain
MHFVRLATPTTDDRRLPTVLAHTSGFLYYVSIAGITGTASATKDTIHAAVTRLKNHTDLPVAVGFGIKTPEQAAAVAQVADAAVVGSSIVQTIADNLDANGQPAAHLVDTVLDFVRALADGVRGARQHAAD